MSHYAITLNINNFNHKIRDYYSFATKREILDFISHIPNSFLPPIFDGHFNEGSRNKKYKAYETPKTNAENLDLYRVKYLTPNKKFMEIRYCYSPNEHLLPVFLGFAPYEHGYTIEIIEAHKISAPCEIQSPYTFQIGDI